MKFYSDAVCFPRGSFEREMRNRGMKLIFCHSLIRYNHSNIRFCKEIFGDSYAEICHTQDGTIRRAFKKNPGRIMDPDADIQYEWWVKTKEDLIAFTTYLRDSLPLEPTSLMEKNRAEADDLGDDGIIRLGLEYSPTMTAIHVLGLEGWTYARNDWSEEYTFFLEILHSYNHLQFIAALELEQPWILMAAEITDNISPEIYRTDVLPHFERYNPALKARGHKIGIHAHAKYLSHYVDIIKEMQSDWIESFTPPPFGDLRLQDARKAWGDDVFIWVNIPESIFYQSPGVIKKWAHDLAEQGSENTAIGFGEMGMMGVTQENRQLFEDGIRIILDEVL